MPRTVDTLTTTTYLQVPKVVSRRKSKSRPRSNSPKSVGILHSPVIKQQQYQQHHQQHHQQQQHRIPSPPSPPPSPMSDTHRGSTTTTTTANASFRCPRSCASFTSTFDGVKPDLDYNGSSAMSAYSDLDLNGDLYTLAPSPSPPPMPRVPLRQRLIGSWRLESYVAYPTPSCKIQRPTFPMTKNVTGLILYTPDGYMSAMMHIPGQGAFKRGEGEEPQWAEAGKRSFCYAGPYYISNDGRGREEMLRHTFQVCNLPGWVGDVQVRTWRFDEDDDLLVLGSEEPTEIRGEFRIPELRWRRAKDNSNGSPPPPMPQIKVSGPGEP